MQIFLRRFKSQKMIVKSLKIADIFERFCNLSSIRSVIKRRTRNISWSTSLLQSFILLIFQNKNLHTYNNAKNGDIITRKTLTYFCVGRVVNLYISRLSFSFDQYYFTFILTAFQYFTKIIMKNYRFCLRYFLFQTYHKEK